jgi:hypothetical protein
MGYREKYFLVKNWQALGTSSDSLNCFSIVCLLFIVEKFNCEEKWKKVKKKNRKKYKKKKSSILNLFLEQFLVLSQL